MVMNLTKAFDKVWHKGLIFKVEKYGIKGNLLKWLTSYLTYRKQMVVISGNSSDIKCLKQVYPKALCLDHYYFFFILMISVNMTCVMTQVYLSKLETICTMQPQS